MPPAARITDVVQHGLGLLGMLAGALIGAALVVGTCATGGLLGAALVAGAVAGGGLAGGKIMNGLATIFNIPGISTGTIIMQASPNVLIGKPKLMASRAKLDGAVCDGVMTLYHWPMPTALVAQGSASVSINGQPAARVGDKLVCGGSIKHGDETVIIGGATATVLPIHDPEEELADVLKVVALASAIILTGGAIGGVLAGTLSAGAFFGGLGIAAAFGVTSWAAEKYLPPGWNQLVSGVVDLVGLATMTKLAEGLAEPIYPPTGEVCTMATDFVLPGALELRFERYYASSLEESDWLGSNWTCSWGQRVKNIGAGVVQYFPGDGRRIVFDFSDEADQQDWLSNPKVSDIKLRTTAAGFEVRNRNGELQRFHQAVGNTWLITSIEDRNNNAIYFCYDESGALRSVQHSGGYCLRVAGTADRITAIELEASVLDFHPLVTYEYDAAGHLTGVDNGSGQLLRYEYDAAARMTRWQDRVGTWTQYAYDAQGKCIESVGPNGMYGYAFTYDAETRTTTATDPYGSTILVRYDEFNRVVAKHDQNGNVTLTAWDGRGNKVAVTDPAMRSVKCEYDDSGNLIASVNSAGEATKFEYDEHGRPVAFIDAAGKRWLRRYDSRGNLVEAALEGELGWRYDHDAAGNIVAATDPGGNTRIYSYDAAGLPLSMTDCEGNVTRYVRDAFGRVKSHVDALGQETRFTYNKLRKLDRVLLPNDTKVEWHYDAEGNVTERIGADGRTYRYQYGPYDKVQAIQQPSGALLQFRHDLEGRLAEVVNERGEIWKYEFDNAGRVFRETEFSGRTQLFRYDAAGLLVERVNGNGEATVLQRDKSGRVVKKRSADGVEVEFEYDANGFMALAKNQTVTVEFERDAYGRVVRETQGQHVVESSFDARGLRIKRRVDGQETAWRHDANGRIRGLGLPGDEWLEFTRDAVGRNTERRLARQGTTAAKAGFLLRQEFDPMSQLIRQWAGAGASAVSERKLRYDANGDVVAMEESLWGESGYSYDPDGRLQNVGRQLGFSQNFRYDEAGEIASVWTSGLQGTSADNLSTVRSLQMRFVGRGGRLEKVDEKQFIYDADGRTVEKRVGAKAWRYEWTVEGQLRAVVTPDGERWTYEYDAFGRRVRKSGPRGSTSYVWDGAVVAEEIRERAGASLQRAAWHFEPGTFRPVAKVENGHAYACVTDQVGTPRELVTRNGKLAWSVQLTAFGQVEAVEENETDCPIRFQGQWFDEESGLHYNWNRYYEPETGKYLSSDPIGLEGGTRSYEYVHNPLSWVDPWGLTGDDGSPQTANPNDLNFSQRSVGPGADQYQQSMENGTWDWDRSGPLRVMDQNGQLVSYDNRRLMAAQKAGLDSVPIEKVNPNDIMPGSKKTWAKAFEQRMNDPRNIAEGGRVPEGGLKSQPKIICK